jgi:hypothetical protein
MKSEPLASYSSPTPIDLPPLCARCGEETSHRIRVRARKVYDDHPLIVRALLVLSGFHLIVYFLQTLNFKSVKIPCCARCHLLLYAANLSFGFFALVVPGVCVYLIANWLAITAWWTLALIILCIASFCASPAIFTRLKRAAAPVEVFRYQGELIYCFYTDVYENARSRPRTFSGVPKSFDFPMR